MAITALNNIKNWFKTGLIPTQAQFWDTWDSFRHKSEKVPVADVEGIDMILDTKADQADFEYHLTDPNAHNDKFNSKLDSSEFYDHTVDQDAHRDLFNLKEDKSEKGTANGYAPLNEFTKIAVEYLNIVNDVVTGGATSILSAEQGKILQNRIDAINLILTSDNINLDTIQELVDAIESVQNYLNSILVNDLTTGGTTKALTAEMGKSLKALIDAQAANKVDKVAGERLISAAEIAKLLGIEAGAQVNQDISGKQDIMNQIFVNTSGLVQDSWHGKLVTFTASVTLTVPASGLRTGFNFEGVVDPTLTITTAMTAPKTWFGGYVGAQIPENSIFTFVQRANDDNKISIYGL